MLDELLDLFPGLRKELFAPDGNLYGHVHVFINGRDVQQLAEGLDYAIQAEDTINIFPAVGGG